MDMKQILIFALLLVPVWTNKMHRCYDEQDLEDAAWKKLNNHYPQPRDPSRAAARDSPFSCPVELYQQLPPQGDMSARSVSPWRYVYVTNKDHFPPTYTEAQCLCSGCILIQGNSDKASLPVESYDYNSVPIKQSRVFLKRELCVDEQNEEKKYHLVPVAVEVAVGCTCVRAKTSS